MKKIRRFETYNNKLKQELNITIDDAKSEMKMVDNHSIFESQYMEDFDKMSQSAIQRDISALNGSIGGE